MSEEIIGYIDPTGSGTGHWVARYCRTCHQVHRIMLPQAEPQSIPETPLWWDVVMALGTLFVSTVLFVAFGPLVVVAGAAIGLVFWLGRRHGR